jgi:hypothetical protein
MYFVLKSLNFIYIIPLYMFRTPLCPSSGAFYSSYYNDVRNHEPETEKNISIEPL